MGGFDTFYRWDMLRGFLRNLSSLDFPVGAWRVRGS